MGGYYWRPTIVADLPHGSRVVQEEIFGPVVTVHRFRGEDEAVELANDTKYGLAAQVCSSAIGRSVSRSVGWLTGAKVEFPFVLLVIVRRSSWPGCIHAYKYTSSSVGVGR